MIDLIKLYQILSVRHEDCRWKKLQDEYEAGWYAGRNDGYDIGKRDGFKQGIRDCDEGY